MSDFSTKHYDSFDFIYTLTESDKKAGHVVIRIDPYFVSNHWKLGSKDESGALFHNLKTIARFGYKNTPEREIQALIVQSAALARINNIDISAVVNKLLNKEPEDAQALISRSYHTHTLDCIAKELKEIYESTDDKFRTSKLGNLISAVYALKDPN